MSKHAKPVPKHRAAPVRPALVETPRKAIRSGVVFSTVAVAATGVTVGGGLAASSPAATASLSASAEARADTTSETPASAAARPASDLGVDVSDEVAREVAARGEVVSRGAVDRRQAADPVKETTLTAEADGPAVSGSENLSDADPRTVAKALLTEFGFGQDQFGCLDSLYMRESGWNVSANNPTSSAYGIPQALPGSKMASAGADWETNPVTQIRWGLGYIQDRYGSPCGAWGHSQAVGWY